MKKKIAILLMACLFGSCSLIAPHIDQAQQLEQQTVQLKRIADYLEIISQDIQKQK